MRRVVLILTTSILMSLLVAANSFADDTITPLPDAFDAGAVSLTFSAKASGEMLQVEVKKELPESFIAKVEKGTTVFDFFGDKVSIFTGSAIMVDLTDNAEGSFLVQQTGNTKITSGGFTWKKLPPK